MRDAVVSQAARTRIRTARGHLPREVENPGGGAWRADERGLAIGEQPVVVRLAAVRHDWGARDIIPCPTITCQQQRAGYDNCCCADLSALCHCTSTRARPLQPAKSELPRTEWKVRRLGDVRRRCHAAKACFCAVVRQQRRVRKAVPVGGRKEGHCLGHERS